MTTDTQQPPTRSRRPTLRRAVVGGGIVIGVVLILGLWSGSRAKTEDCMSLRLFGWAETGGARGNWVVYGINLVKEGDQVKPLTLEDCFTEGSEWSATLLSLIIQGLREQEASGAMGEDFTLYRVDLTFTVSEDGLVFMFSPYEVASYAEGAFFVTVPWEALRPTLRADIGPELLPDQEPHK